MESSIAKILVERANELDQASITERSQNPRNNIQVIEQDLTVARSRNDAKMINFPFKSFFVEEATDSSTKAYLLPGDDSLQQFAVPLKFNASWSIDYAIPKASIYWDAQPGKKIKIYFFLDSKYESGVQVSITSGAMKIDEGSSLTTAPVNLAAGVAAQIVPGGNTGRTVNVQNISGADLWIGSVGVSDTGANRGLRIPDGGIFPYKNSAALYGFSAGGATPAVVRMEEV